MKSLIKRGFSLKTGVFVVVALGLYGSLWALRARCGLLHPMANLRYYYYGDEPGSTLDKGLYVFFYPVYVQGDAKGVHWSDRTD